MGSRAIRWDDDGNILELQDIGSNAGFTHTAANAINDAGEVAGDGLKHVAGLNKGERGIKWDAAGNALELGDIGTDEFGQTRARASSINNLGQTVGDSLWYIDGDRQDWEHAVYWRPNGTAVDLNTIIAPDSGWELVSARSISDTGWIAGWGLYDTDGPGGFDPYERHFLLKISTPNNWTNPGGGTWQTAGNWSGNTASVPGHDAVFNLVAPSPYIVTLAAAAQANNLFVDTHQVLINLAGNPLRVGGLAVGRTVGQVAGLSITGGTITASIASVGGSASSAGGTGVINLEAGGGLKVTGGLRIFDTSGTAVNLMGGTLSVGSLDTSGNPSRLNWSSGTLEITASYLTIGAAGPLGNSAQLSPGKTLRIKDAARALHVTTGGSLDFTGGTLDLTDKKLIVGGGDAGTSDGTTYSGLSDQIQSGHNGGAWNGDGIVTSHPNALTGLTSLGIATAAQAGYAGGTFAGIPVSGGDVLVMYTYKGDANLDGFISADDYTAIDFAIATPGAAGWINGDFNFDGFISADDYTAIDFNLVAQGAPFLTAAATAAALSSAAASPVPEPAAAVFALALLTLPARRQRRPRVRLTDNSPGGFSSAGPLHLCATHNESHRGRKC